MKRASWVADALYMLAPQYEPDFPSLAVTATGILFYGDEALTWAHEVLATGLYHEVWHILRDHCRDSLPRDYLRLIALDLEVNDDIIAEGRWQVPDWAVRPSNFQLPDGKTAQWYYDALRQVGVSRHGEVVMAGCCGSCTDHAPSDGKGEGSESGGLTNIRLRRIQVAVAQNIQDAHARGGGGLPHRVLRWASTVLAPPRVRWQDQLRVAVGNAVEYRTGATSYTYERPSRRQAALGWGSGTPILPSMVRTTPSVLLAGDTSGSMSQGDLSVILEEGAGLIEAAGGRVKFVACDCSVHKIIECTSWRQIAENLVGGGGTSFVPVFDVIERMRDRPDVVVFVTDGYGQAPKFPPPGIRVIWVIVGGGRKPCDWGVFIELEGHA
jgi:predicted metal-dependent peptidase